MDKRRVFSSIKAEVYRIFGLVGSWSMPAHFTICTGGSAIPKKLREQMHVPEVEAIEKKKRRKAA